jgi:hypothetical protein
MFTIFKKSGEEWELLLSVETFEEALFIANIDSEIVHRIERKDGANSEILEN